MRVLTDPVEIKVFRKKQLRKIGGMVSHAACEAILKVTIAAAATSIGLGLLALAVFAMSYILSVGTVI